MQPNEVSVCPAMETIFRKRECCVFVPSSVKNPLRCGCGRLRADHPSVANMDEDDLPKNVQRRQRWRPSKHSQALATDAYGTIEFQGGSHPIKAKYVRLAHDTESNKVIDLLTNHWNLRSPKLLMSIHGGKVNFALQQNLKKVILEGLLKAARTTEAWIFTEGTNTGVVKHVGEAFKNERAQTLQRSMATIGIVPWGTINHREDLVGKNVTVPYSSISSPKSKFPVLNDRHAFFLLVDDGTVEKSGSEIRFRRKLEKDIRKKVVHDCEASGFHIRDRCSLLAPQNYPSAKERRIPIVGVIIEGGINTIRTVLEYVTDSYPVPVVVCDGSGRAADLLAFTHKYLLENGTLPGSLQDHLHTKIMDTFQCDDTDAGRVLKDLVQCVQKKELITVFRMGEGHDLDQAILTSLLKGSGLNPLEQFTLALTWNRVDIASLELFAYGQEWTNEMLEEAMMEALIVNNVDFVKLLLENGLHLSKFLTFERLEALYNTKRGPTNTLEYLIKDTRKHSATTEYNLLEIGSVVENLMGGTYSSRYRTRKFRDRYSEFRQKKKAMGGQSPPCKVDDSRRDFPNAYQDLFTWSILTKRQEVALFMWQRGEEAMAKALVAIKLYKSMAQEAEQDDLKADISESFRKFSRKILLAMTLVKHQNCIRSTENAIRMADVMTIKTEWVIHIGQKHSRGCMSTVIWTFEDISVNLLDFCYRQNETLAQRLLTYELQNWGKQTCLTLAVSASHRTFLAHPCCQILLADLWMGGLRTRKSTNIKVLVGLFLPLLIPLLEFKSEKEINSMPQTEEEHGPHHDEDDSIVGDSDVASIDIEQTVHSIEKPKTNGLVNGISHSRNFTHPEHLNQPLTLKTKFWEFYTSPLTKFLGYSLAYFLFLIIFTYSVLVRMRVMPSWAEYYCLVYIITLTLEKFREIIISEPVRFSHKVVMWMDGNKWNPCDVVAILVFFIAFGVRMSPEDLETARAFYACDIMYWYLRILHILSVNKYLGPFVAMIGKMVINMSYFIVLLLVVLMAYGVARQGILHPHEDPSWTLVRNVFYKPYFMLYGEVFADTIDPACGDSPDLTPCRTGRWVAIVAMCMFLLVANILLINLLIAVFNNIFLNVDAVAQQVWKSKRYSVVMEYEQKPVLPPPLILLSHIRMILKYVFSKKTSRNPCPVLKLFLSDEELLSLQNFEEQCVDGFLLEEDNKLHSSTSELVKFNNSKVEYLTQRVNDLYRRSSETVASLRSLKYTVRQLSQEVRVTSDRCTLIQRHLNDVDAIDEVSEVSDDGDSESGDSVAAGDLQDDHDVSRRDEGSLRWSSPDDSGGDDSDGYGFADRRLGGSGGCRRHVQEMPSRLRSGGATNQETAWISKYYGGRRTRRLRRQSSLSTDSTRPTDDAADRIEPCSRKMSVVGQPLPAIATSALMRKRAARRASLQVGVALAPTDVAEQSEVPCTIRRRSSTRTSQRSTASNGPRRPSPTPAVVPAATLLSAGPMPDTPQTPNVGRLVHEYTSITDDIETQQVLQRLAQDQTSPAAATAQTRRLSCVALQLANHTLPETQQAILAKEEQLLEAEKQEYLRMAKCAERRARRDSETSKTNAATVADDPRPPDTGDPAGDPLQGPLEEADDENTDDERDDDSKD